MLRREKFIAKQMQVQFLSIATAVRNGHHREGKQIVAGKQKEQNAFRGGKFLNCVAFLWKHSDNFSEILFNFRNFKFKLFLSSFFQR